MEKQTPNTSFMAISRLYMQIAQQDKTVISKKESEILIANINYSNLTDLFKPQDQTLIRSTIQK